MNLRNPVARLSRAHREKTSLEPLVVAILPNGQLLACLEGAWLEWSPNVALPPWCKMYRGIDPRLVA
jgi:hypothetical protein